MSLTREEIEVKLGLDANEISMQGEGAGALFGNKFLSKMQRSLNKQAFHFVWSNLVGDVVQKWDELTKWMAQKWYDMAYEIGKTSVLAEEAKQLRSLVLARDLANLELSTAEKKAEFDDASVIGKLDILEQEKLLADNKRASMESELAANKELRDIETRLRGEWYKSSDEKLKLTEKIASQEIGITKTKLDQLKINRAITNLEREREAERRSILGRVEKESEKEKQLSDTLRPQVSPTITDADREAEKRRKVFNAQRLLDGLPMIPQALPHPGLLVDPKSRPDMTTKEVQILNENLLRLWQQGLQMKAAE